MIMKFLREESGQGLVEYALILALIAIAVIGAMTALGGQVSTNMNAIKTELSGV